MFEVEANEIRRVFGDLALQVEHVGSTAVPGLSAKPVIDIQISVTSLVTFDPYLGHLACLGYVHVPLGDFDRVYPFFQKPAERCAMLRRSCPLVCERESSRRRDTWPFAITFALIPKLRGNTLSSNSRSRRNITEPLRNHARAILWRRVSFVEADGSESRARGGRSQWHLTPPSSDGRNFSAAASPLSTPLSCLFLIPRARHIRRVV